MIALSDISSANPTLHQNKPRTKIPKSFFTFSI